MVVPTSTEYTRSYKPKVFVRAGRLYDENLEFRLQKREMEQNHTTSPFMWDPSDLETDSSDRSNGSVEQQRPMSVPPHKYKHEKFNRSYQKRLLQQQQQQEEEEEEDYSSPERRGRSKERRGRQERSPSRSQSRGRCSGESVPRTSKPPRHTQAQPQMNGRHSPTFMNGVAILRDQGVQTPDWTRMKGRKTVHPSASFESSSSECPEVWVRSNKHRGHHYKSPCSVDGHSDNTAPGKPDRWRTKHRHATQSSSPESADRRLLRSPPCQSANINGNRVVRPPAAVSVTKKPPFVTYGSQCREREIGMKKTHNVLASTDLHPTAIQALKRRELVKAVKQKQSRTTSDRPKSQQSMMSEFDQKMNKATSKWETEYQSHYPRYCNTEYERNIMSRQQTSRSVQNFWIDW